MKANIEPTITANGQASAGFTLVELLVVTACVMILVALLLPGLARGNQLAVGDQCLCNLQQLGQAWLMYYTDSRGNFVPNGGEGAQGADNPTSQDLRPGGQSAQWCPGRQDPGVTDSETAQGYLSPSTLAANQPNIGWEWIQAGLLYPYVKNVRHYLCPADQSYNVFAGVRYPHVRSRSMNAWLSPLDGAWTGGSQDANMRVYSKQSDLTVPGPANAFLFIDENQQSINDAWFLADPSEPTVAKPEWIDAPASYHNGASGLSFCDGHVGLKKWRDPVLLSFTQMQDENRWENSSIGQPSKYEPDVKWLVNRTTALKSTTAFLGPKGW